MEQRTMSWGSSERCRDRWGRFRTITRGFLERSRDRWCRFSSSEERIVNSFDGAPLKCIWQENCEIRGDYTTLVEL